MRRIRMSARGTETERSPRRTTPLKPVYRTLAEFKLHLGWAPVTTSRGRFRLPGLRGSPCGPCLNEHRSSYPDDFDVTRKQAGPGCEIPCLTGCFTLDRSTPVFGFRQSCSL